MSALKLAPAEKVAILLMALGEDIAAEVFQNLDPVEVRRIGAAMSQLGRIEQSTIDIVIHEFLGLLNTKSSTLGTNGVDFAQRAIRLAFKTSEGEELASAISKGDVRMRALEVADPATLARILQNELPQTLALVLAHATPEKASTLLKLWPERIRAELLMRVAKLGPVDPETVAQLDQHLLQELEKVGSSRQLKRGGPQAVASILNRMDKEGLGLLERLGERQPDLASEIREKMFTFDDLHLLDDRGLQELIKIVPQTKLCLALRGTSEKIQQLFFRNMSQRAAKLLKEDMAAAAPQKLSDVVKVQNEILEVVRKLEDEGKIVIEREVRKVV